jgi:hypothetical protein
MSLIAIIAIPAYTNVSKNIKKSSLENKEKVISKQMLKYANQYLIDDIKPDNENCSDQKNCCKNYDLYDYIVKNDIYAIETIIKENNVDKSVIINPMTNKVLYGYVQIKYNKNKYNLEAEFYEGTGLAFNNGVAECS